MHGEPRSKNVPVHAKIGNSNGEYYIYIFEIGNQYSVYEHIKVHNSKIFKSDWNAYLLAYMPTSALT